jgi:hypothetical protein
MDLFLAPLTDGISGRRGSVVAALQHGLPVCSTVRTYTDAYLKNLVSPAFSLVPHDNQKLFCEEAVCMAEKALQQPNFGHELTEFHDRHFAWPVIAERMTAGLLTAQKAGPHITTDREQSPEAENRRYTLQ